MVKLNPLLCTGHLNVKNMGVLKGGEKNKQQQGKAGLTASEKRQ
jgi:hypothetical protein